jgi:YHS domain-containing protein
MSLTRTIAAALLLAACASEPSANIAPPSKPEPAPSEPSAASKPPAVTRVDPSLVCMVNNQFMGKAQIPVAVEGKTYFGCCEMCKSRLADDAESRMATDPVSGARVDKAVAVIGREASGSVVYFENASNLERFASR